MSWHSYLRAARSNPRRPGYAQNTADASGRTALDSGVSRDWHLGQVDRIDPDIVFGAVMVQHTAMLAQVPFELAAIPGRTLISESRMPTSGGSVSPAIA